jgi:hypothetical protein
MPYYLAPYVGTGTALDPFRPRGSEQPGWSAIDLRPDSSRLDGGGLNACLLHLLVANPDPLLQLVALDPADTIGAALRQALATRLTLVTAPTSRWDDLAMELMLSPPPNGWKALRPTVAGLYEVWLGTLLKSIASIRGGASISENWNCADSASLTCQLTWTELLGTDWGITSTRAQIQAFSGLFQLVRAGSALASADHYCQATLAAFTTQSATTTAGPAVRIDATVGDATYFFRAESDPGGVQTQLWKRVAASFTSLGTNATAPVVADIIRVEANGSSITGKMNGTARVGPITDTAITGNLQCGIVGDADTVGQVTALDDWSAADLAAGGAPQRTLTGVGATLLPPLWLQYLLVKLHDKTLQTRRRMMGVGP